MSLSRFVSETSTNRPRIVLGIIALTALVLALLAALPSIWPGQFSALNPLQVDTDPENMLSPEEPVRIFHNRMKEKFNLHDIIVVGVVNDEHPQGVFNQESLTRIHELTEFAKTLQGGAIGSPDPRAGVVRRDIIAPSTVDNIEQGGDRHGPL